MHADFFQMGREYLSDRYLENTQLAKKYYDLAMEPVCREWDLTRNELDVLLFLFNNPSFDRAADIVRIRRLTKSHVSLSVNNMESRGLLIREYDPDDRRVAHLKLTAKALPMAAAAREAQQTFLQSLFQGLTREEMELWQGILEKIHNNIRQLEET